MVRRILKCGALVEGAIVSVEVEYEDGRTELPPQLKLWKKEDQTNGVGLHIANLVRPRIAACGCCEEFKALIFVVPRGRLDNQKAFDYNLVLMDKVAMLV